MAQGDPVTLISPDGQTRWTTDQPTEVTTLITSHGYRRVTEQPEPAPAAPVHSEPESDDDPLWIDEHDDD